MLFELPLALVAESVVVAESEVAPDTDTVDLELLTDSAEAAVVELLLLESTVMSFEPEDDAESKLPTSSELVVESLPYEPTLALVESEANEEDESREAESEVSREAEADVSTEAEAEAVADAAVEADASVVYEVEESASAPVEADEVDEEAAGVVVGVSVVGTGVGVAVVGVGVAVVGVGVAVVGVGVAVVGVGVVVEELESVETVTLNLSAPVYESKP